MQNCLEPLGRHSIEFSAVQCYQGYNTKLSISLVLSSIIE